MPLKIVDFVRLAITFLVDIFRFFFGLPRMYARLANDPGPKKPHQPVEQSCQVVEPIGSGDPGFAVVVCRGILTNKDVAIKMLFPFQTELSARLVFREVALIRRLPPHPNIIKLLGAFTVSIDDEPFDTLGFVTKLMDQNLSNFIVNGGVNVQHEQFSRLIYQLLCAVNHLHRCGIIHCDLKPSNILVNKSGRELKLMGFDQACCQNPKIQTPDDHGYSTKGDIWAVGCIFAEMTFRGECYLPRREDEFDQWMKFTANLGIPCEAFMVNIPLYDQIYNDLMAWDPIPPFEVKFPDHVFPKTSMEHPDCLNAAQARDLLKQLLSMDPDSRPTAEQAISHPYVSLWYNADEVNGPMEPFNFDVSQTEREQTIEHWHRLLLEEIASMNTNN